MLEAFNRAGVTCIISTHDERLLQDADRIVELLHGHLIGIRSADSEVGA
jgi:ABC-type ATPase involved in cell division